MAAKRQKSRTRLPAPSASRPPRRAPAALFAAAIVIAGTWAYGNSLAGVFVLDDVRAIVRNESIRTLSTAMSPPGESTVSGRPLANLTFALNYALAPAEAREAFTPGQPAEPGARGRFERNARGYHIVNVVIHIAAALVLYGIIRRTLLTEPLRAEFQEAAPYVALATAAVWVVHPLNTEAVTYIVQRVESLMGLLYLLTLYCAIRAADAANRARWAAGAVLCCALGMAAKEVMVTAPVVVAAWDHVFRRGAAPRWALLSGLAATWIVFAALVLNEYRAASIAFDAGVAWRYLLTQSAVLIHYVRLSFVPAPLVFLYDWPLATGIADVALPAAMVAAGLGLTIAGLVRRHPLGFVGACFFVILSPTSSVIPIVTEVVAEHRMYLPLAALLAGTVAGVFALSRRLFTDPLARGGSRRRVLQAAGALAVMAMVVVLGTFTRARNRDYHSEEALWRDTVDKQPTAQRARVAYGAALASNRRLAEAEAQYRAAVSLNDRDALAHTRLGSVLAAQDRIDAALPHFQRAVALRPEDADAHRALGQIYALRREDAAAVRHLAQAVELVPEDPVLRARLAALLAESRDPLVRNPKRAVAVASEAARLTGRREPLVLEILASALAADGRLAEAAAAVREALSIARHQRNAALVSRLEYRLSAYER